MANEAVSALILFIASIIIAAAVGTELIFLVQDLANSMETEGASLSEEISTNIEIINDLSADTPYDSGNDEYVIYVKNTGSTILSTDSDAGETDVFIEGNIRTNFTISMADSNKDIWEPGTVAEITVPDTTAPSGETVITVIVNGNRDTIVFNA